MKSVYTWIFDAGHGGVDKDGNYTTDAKIGKRFTFPDGFTVLEGVENRKIAKDIFKELDKLGFVYKTCYDDVLDWSLTKRLQVVEKLQKEYKNCILISLHSNAGKGSGFEIFTSPGQDKSDKIATYFCMEYLMSFIEFPFRPDKSDGDLDKEAKFAMVNHTHCPSILIENLFFDNRKDAEFLVSEAGRKRIVTTIVNSILKIERDRPI